MKKRLFFLGASAFLLVSCNSKPAKTTSAEQPPVEKKSNEFCYSYTQNKDNVFLNFKMSDDSLILGKLNYHFHEKDSNDGIVQGQMRGDTLFLDYIFTSEGVETVREVVFLKKGEDFVEGYGDAEEKNGRMVFKNTSKLDFNNSILLKHVDCK
ncbi:hypothetical protein [Solitalea canadensis]|uniref:Lipoprotein n=1 Tax=Solitalea canadensis (strain ATCC 29591 / DSM 3403 / JCM 21819 / LMG 8368 / NBRC 15130 / NCIMB 12057 / USAM 9D) TaxID=929556 RepID=H8KT21_SOLCM|nr:hypothetical protein [Solitalea canadensis]AFD05592.1 hypothetical protein Solca_0460 [Solitalea canadensis DSM 3403]